ncbi:MAG: YebC/PmpR family DNA-binding transcriptional regulator [Oscillospiraceae bacterium]|nr:YebC/PmpR family DNA-binding transcriptional regulator [Candidatus Limimonas coprohippi]
MSGHSKWSTIKRKKGANDAAMAKVFTKIGREIAVAVKEGGPDPASNSKLKNVIAKAKAANIPNDNIDRAIKKAAGEGSTANYEENIYEGYGPAGIAVIVETLTDNKNRTAGNVRHYFDKCGGNMGQSGCVSFMFSRYGVIAIEKEDVDEEALMDAALEAGAVDFLSDDESVFEIRTEANDIGAVHDALEAAGYKFALSEVQYIPSTYTKIEGEDALKGMAKMLAMFEDDDDVQNVWHNWENEEDAGEYM